VINSLFSTHPRLTVTCVSTIPVGNIIICNSIAKEIGKKNIDISSQKDVKTIQMVKCHRDHIHMVHYSKQSQNDVFKKSI
jgi:hypothetical protein